MVFNSAQAYADDPRNGGVQVWLDGRLVPRQEARVSVFDAGFICGDGVWEGLRLVEGGIVAFGAHIRRLLDGARAIDLDIGLDADALKAVVRETFAANAMRDDAHARLMVTRGIKSTPNQDPRFVLGGPTIVCVAEHKAVAADAPPLRLFTSSVRCSAPDVFDLRLNSHSRLNLIQALIQALHAGADEALMLDPHGFVSSCNSTNLFFVRDGALCTSSGRFCFNGITRATVLALARADGIAVHEGDFTPAQLLVADEAFVTGTLGGLRPVGRLDGRSLPTGGALTRHLSALYQAHASSTAERL